MRDDRRALAFARADQRRERHDSARRRVDVDVLQVSDHRAIRRVGLNEDAIGPIEVIEVIDVERAEVDLERVEDVAERNAERFRLLAIDIDHELRAVVAEGRKDRAQVRIAIGGADDPIRGVRQRVEPERPRVFQLELIAAEVADALNRRRREREDLRLRNLGELRIEHVIEDRRERMLVTRPLAPRLEAYEHRRLVRTVAGEAETDDVEDVTHLGPSGDDALDALGDLLGLVDRRPLGCLHGRDEEALVFVGCEARRRDFEEESGQSESADKQRD